MITNSRLGFSIFTAVLFIVLGALPRIGSAALVETINITDFTLDNSQIGPFSSSSQLQQWEVRFASTTTSLNTGDMIALNIDFAGTQKLQIGAPGNTSFIPFLSARPDALATHDGTKIYDFTMEFTGVSGELKQNNLMVDISVLGGGLLSQAFDVTDSLFSFADLHFLLTATKDLTFTNLNLEIDLRAEEISIVGDVSPVPLPAAAWLFGTALIGLVGFSKRRKTV